MGLCSITFGFYLHFGGLCANFVSDLFVQPNYSSPGSESLSLGAPLNIQGAAHATAVPSLVGVSKFSLGSIPSW